MSRRRGMVPARHLRDQLPVAEPVMVVAAICRSPNRSARLTSRTMPGLLGALLKLLACNDHRASVEFGTE